MIITGTLNSVEFREQIWPWQKFGVYRRDFNHGATETWYGLRIGYFRLGLAWNR